MEETEFQMCPMELLLDKSCLCRTDVISLDCRCFDCSLRLSYLPMLSGCSWISLDCDRSSLLDQTWFDVSIASKDIVTIAAL